MLKGVVINEGWIKPNPPARLAQVQLYSRILKPRAHYKLQISVCPSPKRVSRFLPCVEALYGNLAHTLGARAVFAPPPLPIPASFLI